MTTPSDWTTAIDDRLVGRLSHCLHCGRRSTVLHCRIWEGAGLAVEMARCPACAAADPHGEKLEAVMQHRYSLRENGAVCPGA